MCMRPCLSVLSCPLLFQWALGILHVIRTPSILHVIRAECTKRLNTGQSRVYLGACVCVYESMRQCKHGYLIACMRTCAICVACLRARDNACIPVCMLTCVHAHMSARVHIRTLKGSRTKYMRSPSPGRARLG